MRRNRVIGVVLWTLAAVVVLLYLGSLALAGFVALHPPRSPVFFSPGAMGFDQETFDFQNADGTRLRATWVPHPDPKGVVVAVHGYCMNRSEFAPFTPMFAERGLSILFFDVRNHGQSARGRCGIGWYERQDVKAAVAEARRRVPNAPVILLGSSMGSAASAFAVAEERDLVEAVILDSCYDSLHDVADGWWHFLGKMSAFPRLWRGMFWPLVRIAKPLLGFSPKAATTSVKLRGYDRPVLLMHGKTDTIAPPFCAQRIFDALAGPKELVFFDNSDHAEMRWLQPDKYRDRVGAFLDALGLPRVEKADVDFS